MIDRKKMLDLMMEVGINTEQPMTEDWANMGVDPEAMEYVMRLVMNSFINDVHANRNPGLAAATLFCVALELGFKVAVEAEMQRIQDAPLTD